MGGRGEGGSGEEGLSFDSGKVWDGVEVVW